MSTYFCVFAVAGVLGQGPGFAVHVLGFLGFPVKVFHFVVGGGVVCKIC